MFRHIYISTIVIGLVLSSSALFMSQLHADVYQGEHITYEIKPLGGRAEYFDMGLTDLNGRTVKLTVFKTSVMFFKDTEKVYSDPDTMLPIRVERDIKRWFGRENIVEEYDQKQYKFSITKYNGRKMLSKQVYSADGPIHNATLVPFYLRKVPDVKLGWSFVLFLPQRYEVRLVALDEIRAGEQTLAAYHFKSIPENFEIWISKDERHVPLAIKSNGGLKYALLMREYIPPSGSVTTSKGFIYAKEEN